MIEEAIHVCSKLNTLEATMGPKIKTGEQTINDGQILAFKTYSSKGKDIC